ncbi:ATP-binding cassette domain-containing protein [Streptomyces sp. RKND-216]|nr:ATP-binding cassette domain-containing protein [Streptomyces sp. RKND-216]
MQRPRQTEGATVTADGLGLRGPRGPVFADVELRAPEGALIVVDGPSGSGRTALLLTLTGRMRPDAGTAEVAGRRLPHGAAAVRRMSALGPVPGITDPDPAHSVGEQLRERALLLGRFDGPLRGLLASPRRRSAAARERTEAALAAAGLDPYALPHGVRTRGRDLSRTETFRLGVALALLGRPRLLAVDDVGLKLTDGEETAVWELLASIAAAGTTVLAVGKSPAPAVAGEVPLVVVRTADRVREAV